MMRKIICLALSSVLLSHATYAEEVFDLADIYTLALQQDPTIKIADATRLITGQNLPLAVSTVLPQISADATQNSQRNLVEFTGVAQGDFYSRINSYSLNLDQNVINVSEWFNIRAAQKAVDSAEATFISAQQDLIARVADAYFAVLRAQDALSFTQAEKSAVAKQLDQINQQFDVGLVAITDVQDARARYDLTVAQEIGAKNTLANSIESLKQITGPYFGDLATLDVQIPLQEPQPANMEEWVDTAEQYNPALIASRYSVDSSKEAVRSAKAELLPNVTVTGAWGQGRFGTFSNPSSDWDEAWTFVLNVGVNVFSGGSTVANIRQSQYESLQSMDNLELALRQTQDNTRTAYRDVLTSISEVNAYKQAVLSANTSLESTQAAYEVGTRTSVDLLNSISNLYQQEQNYANSRYDYILSTLALKQATGTVSVGDIIAINEWLSKSNHTTSE